VAASAGAAGLAGVLAHAPRFQGRRVSLVLSGGNIDSRVLGSILMRELVGEGRIRMIRIPILDQPGALAKLTALLKMTALLAAVGPISLKSIIREPP